MSQSTVVDASTGRHAVYPDRTSQGAMFARSENALVADIEKSVAIDTGLPVTRFEGVQVMRYEKGQEYKAHFDYFEPSNPGSLRHLRNGGQRVLTALMYLSTPFEGEGRPFPRSA